MSHFIKKDGIKNSKQKKFYSHGFKFGSPEYRRMRYVCKREGISNEEYCKNPNFMNPKKGRKRVKHLQYPIESTEYRKTIWLKKNYGIDLETYNKILIEQNNVCAICKQINQFNSKFTNKLMSLSVDHCHTTGKVRGLLCNNCNRAIGLFGDNPEILGKAIEYLKNYK